MQTSSLNVDKSNFVIFHPPQKSPTYSIYLKIHDKVIMQKRSIKYLGVLMDNLHNKLKVELDKTNEIFYHS